MSRPVFPKPKSVTKKETTIVKPGQTAPSLSFNELHEKLRARLQSQNVLNDMRAELRNRLVQELYHIAEPDQVPNAAAISEEGSQLPMQISNWLVCNHFQRGNFEFTLSTFLQESGIVTLPEYNMTFHDVLYIFGIHPQTEFYKGIHAKYSSKRTSGGLLFCIVQQLLLCVLPQSLKSYSDEAAQTEHPVTIEENLQRRVLHEVESLRHKLDEEIKSTNVDYARQASSRKGFVCVNCSKEDSTNNAELQRKEVDHLEKLLQKQKENLEQEISQKSQELENKFLSQWQSIQLDMQTTQERAQQYSKRIKEDNKMLDDVKASLETSELKVRDLQTQVDFLKEQYSNALKQHKSLQKKLESMADYEVVKADLSVTRRELEILLSRYQEGQEQWLSNREEFEKKVAQLTLQITSPCLQLLTANREVQKVLQKQEQDQTRWSHEKDQWQRQIKEATIQQHNLLLRIEEQKQHISNLNKVVHNLQLQLEKRHLDHNSSSSLLADIELLKSSISSPVVVNKRIPSESISESSTPSPNSRANYLQEAKRRIDKLQAEADTLERKYGQCLTNQRLASTPYVSSQSAYGKNLQFFSPDLSGTGDHMFVARLQYPSVPNSFLFNSSSYRSTTFPETGLDIGRIPESKDVSLNANFDKSVSKELLSSSMQLDTTTHQYMDNLFPRNAASPANMNHLNMNEIQVSQQTVTLNDNLESLQVTKDQFNHESKTKTESGSSDSFPNGLRASFTISQNFDNHSNQGSEHQENNTLHLSTDKPLEEESNDNHISAKPSGTNFNTTLSQIASPDTSVLNNTTNMSKWNLNTAEANLDAEWQKTKQNESNIAHTMNLDDHWKQRRSGGSQVFGTTTPSYPYNDLKSPSHKLVGSMDNSTEKNKLERDLFDDNIRTSVMPDSENRDLEPNVSVTNSPIKVTAGFEKDDSRRFVVKPSTDIPGLHTHLKQDHQTIEREGKVHAIAEKLTTNAVELNAKDTSMPTVPSPPLKENVESVPSDSDINLSIGDQAQHSNGSNSESFW